MLGPADGRFVVRQPGEGKIVRILAFATLAAPQRRMLRGRKGKAVEQADAEPVPTSRATVIEPQPFGGEADAAAWLEGLRTSDDRLQEELVCSLSVLNRALHLHRCSQADHAARDVSRDSALVVRLGLRRG